jgi:hypothetical protein
MNQISNNKLFFLGIGAFAVIVLAQIFNGYINDYSRAAATLDRQSIKMMLIQNQRNGEVFLNNLNTQMSTQIHNEGVIINNQYAISNMFVNLDNVTKVKEWQSTIRTDYQVFVPKPLNGTPK